MRGGALGLLASAFRLRNAILSGKSNVPEGTVRHGMSDHHDIGRARHGVLVRSVVDELFSAEYLAARGLDGEEAREHNDLVARALDAVLERWDRRAVLTNASPSVAELVGDLVGEVTGFSVELTLRVAAYDALYGYLHPFVDDIPAWMQGPKLQPWWRSVEARARQPIQVSRLYEHAELESHTIRDLRDGKALPKGATIPTLARRLAEHDIRDRHEDRDANAAELEVELRVAVAVAEQRPLVERLLTPRADDALVTRLHALRRMLHDARDAVLEDLLRHGTEARSWSLVDERLKTVHLARVIERASSMKRDADRREAAMQDDPVAAMWELADVFADQATHLRSVDPHPGADGPEKRMAEVLEMQRQVALSSTGDGARPSHKPRPELLAELHADRLCMEVMAPWSNLSAEEREKRLREAVRVCDGSAYAHRALGRYLDKVGKTEEAIAHLRRSVELNPENEGGRELLALVYADRSLYDDVLTVTAREGSSPLLRALRAYALMETGDIDGAEALARAVLDEHPREIVALRALAGCHRARGDKEKARELEMKARLAEGGVRSP